MTIEGALMALAALVGIGVVGWLGLDLKWPPRSSKGLKGKTATAIVVYENTSGRTY